MKIKNYNIEYDLKSLAEHIKSVLVWDKEEHLKISSYHKDSDLLEFKYTKKKFDKLVDTFCKEVLELEPKLESILETNLIFTKKGLLHKGRIQKVIECSDLRIFYSDEYAIEYFVPSLIAYELGESIHIMFEMKKYQERY